MSLAGWLLHNAWSGKDLHKGSIARMHPTPDRKVITSNIKSVCVKRRRNINDASQQHPQLRHAHSRHADPPRHCKAPIKAFEILPNLARAVENKRVKPLGKRLPHKTTEIYRMAHLGEPSFISDHKAEYETLIDIAQSISGETTR